MHSYELTSHIDNEKRSTELRFLLLRAAQNLMPNQNYGLKLFGIKTPYPLLRQFEQQFQRSVDLNEGIDLDLGYDIIEKSFCIKSISCSLEKGRSKGLLLKTESLGLIPSIQTSGKPEAEYLALLEWDDADILKNANIEKPPTQSAAEYSGWRSTLLQRTAGWDLKEYTEHVESHNENYEQKIRISNKEQVGKDSIASRKTQSVERIFGAHSEDGLHSHNIHAVIELEVSESHQKLHTYKYSSETERELFVINNSRTKRTSDLEVISIEDDDNFFAYRDMLERTIDYTDKEQGISRVKN